MNGRLGRLPLCGMALALGACVATDRNFTEPVNLDAQLRAAIGVYGVVPIAAVPQQDTALVTLGRTLFFDKELSGNRDVACATCHQPQASMGDALALAVGTGGVGAGSSRTPGPGRAYVPRNAPSLLNVALGLPYVFLDGRISGFGGTFTTPAGGALPPGLANVIAAQAMFPVTNRREMRGEVGDTDVYGAANELALVGDSDWTGMWQAVIKRLVAIPAYVNAFHAAFPSTPASQLGFQHAANAIAAFEMQQLTRTDSPFDRYLKRDDAALTPEQKRGALLFFGKATCSNCHNGPFLGGQGFADVGVPQLGPGLATQPPLDLGRGELPGNDFYQFAFRIAPLRNVELTAPYFHDGVYQTLAQVVHHYSDVTTDLTTFDPATLPPAVRGLYHGDASTIAAVLNHLDFRLQQPLRLTTTEQAELVAFLQSLTDASARNLSALRPRTVPSGLPVP
ncbi:MAG TPA: cytochrome c peroxidase [Gemmatimonadales bacterium]|nr:cytochrome c peroxidase [Gemmatimonadales bacterium]